jgi:hypothetical protein
MPYGGRYLIWLAVNEVVPPAIYCMIENINPVYDPSTGGWHNAEGVEIRWGFSRSPSPL